MIPDLTQSDSQHQSGIDMPLINHEWTLFLDRDGVINERIIDGYVLDEDSFVFLPCVEEALAALSARFGRIIVVTNQQGIGKGLMDEVALEAIHRKMITLVEAAGGRIDRVIYCPDLAQAGETCRKPGISMGLIARDIFPEIDFNKSIMVGDTSSDMTFARNLGMSSVFVDGGEETSDPGPSGCHIRVQSLYHFARLFIEIKNNQ
jgi:D-glycero-D-manno-heptose 1,7-bisphosphate phosphatase